MAGVAGELPDHREQLLAFHRARLPFHVVALGAMRVRLSDSAGLSRRRELFEARPVSGLELTHGLDALPESKAERLGSQAFDGASQVAPRAETLQDPPGLVAERQRQGPTVLPVTALRQGRRTCVCGAGR